MITCACDASTHLPQPDDPAFALQGVEQRLKRLLVAAGQIEKADEIVKSHGMAHLAHDFEHLGGLQTAGNADERLRGGAGRNLMGTARGRGRPFGGGVTEIPAPTGSFFHGKTFC